MLFTSIGGQSFIFSYGVWGFASLDFVFYLSKFLCVCFCAHLIYTDLRARSLSLISLCCLGSLSLWAC